MTLLKCCSGRGVVQFDHSTERSAPTGATTDGTEVGIGHIEALSPQTLGQGQQAVLDLGAVSLIEATTDALHQRTAFIKRRAELVIVDAAKDRRIYV